MPILYESTDELVAATDNTPLIVACGGAGGSLLCAGLLRLLSKVTGQPEPTGWEKTAVLVGGGFFGGVATYGVVSGLRAKTALARWVQEI